MIQCSCTVWEKVIYYLKEKTTFTHKLKAIHVQLIVTSSSVYEGSCLIYVICVWLRIVVSNTYCTVFLFFIRLVVIVSGLSILVFSSVYLVIKNIIRSIIIIIFLFYQLLQVDKQKNKRKRYKGSKCGHKVENYYIMFGMYT